MKVSNFKTYNLGTAEELMSSEKILLYNRKTLEDKYSYTEKISVYNIEEVYNHVLTTYIKDSYVLSGKTNYVYEYNYSDVATVLPDGFDIIIYVSSADNKPIAYTDFSSVQGKEINLDISVKIESAEIEVNDLEIVNNLNPVQNLQNVTDTNIISTHVLTNIWKEDTRNYTKGEIYTTDTTGDLTIKLTDRVVKGNKIYKLGMNLISSDVDLMNRFDRYSFGFYGSHPCVYVWNSSNSFGIISLADINKYGNNVLYSRYNSYSKENKINSSGYSILYGAGRYLVTEETATGDIRIFDTRLKSFVSKEITGTKCFIDPLDINAEIRVLPDISTRDSILEYIPELSNTFLDIYTDYPSLELIRKVGNWFILRKSVLGNYVYALSGISSAIWMSEEEYKNSVIVNDSAVIINKGTYYLLCGKEKEIYTTEDYKILIGNTGKEIELRGAEMKVTETANLDSLYYRVAPKSEDLYNTFLNSFRKSSYPVNLTKLPEIIGAICGVIFYEEQEDLLNYL